MRNIRLVIEYDGTRYAAFQKLGPKTRGMLVEEKIVEVLKKMTGEDIELISAAKLEAGVHALHQIANFKTNSDKREYEIKHYLNQYLPRDIAILQVDDVPERFHSQLNASSYWFEYRYTMGEVANVFERKYTYYSFKKLDVSAMKEAAAYLIGEHDFKALSNNKKMKKTTVREIYDIQIIQDIDRVTIRVHGSDFWPYMVRKIVGMLYEVGVGNMKPFVVKTILLEKDPQNVQYMAEPQGLFLDEVIYK